MRFDIAKKWLLLMLMAVISISHARTADTDTAPKPANYPKKPLQLIVPSSAGGGTDVMIRALVAEMKLPQPIAIVNREGASGTIGTGEVARAKADGYTLVSGMPAPFYIQPNITNLFFSIEDFRNIAVISPDEQLVIVVTPDSPIKTFEDLKKIMLAGGDIKFGTSNPGSVGHCGLADLFHQMGVKDNFEMVPFKGAANALTALMGDHINVSTCDLAEALPRLRNNQVAPLAVFGEKRSEALPDVPCLTELGYPGTGYAVAFKWISVPKNTPDDIVEYLKAEINKAVLSDGYKKFIREVNGLDTHTMTEAELTQKLKDCRKKYKEILTMTGMAKK